MKVEVSQMAGESKPLLPLLAGWQPEPNETAKQILSPKRTLRPPVPEFGWREIGSEQDELHARDLHTFSNPNNSKMRVSVDADSGVFGGVFNQAVYEQSLQTAGTLRLKDFESAPCPLVGVIKGQTACQWKKFFTLYCSIVNECPTVFTASRHTLKYIDKVEVRGVARGVLLKEWPMLQWIITVRDGSVWNWGSILG